MQDLIKPVLIPLANSVTQKRVLSFEGNVSHTARFDLD